MEKDRRLEHLETQPELRGVQFVRKHYRAYRPGWDHDHCVGCWATLAEPGSTEPDALHEGYATTERYFRGAEYEWVCPECFSLFAPEMGWSDVTPRAGA
jgi:hypothetical protein